MNFVLQNELQNLIVNTGSVMQGSTTFLQSITNNKQGKVIAKLMDYAIQHKIFRL